MTSGIFPDIFKCANVTPLYKSSSTSETTNYRPISLLVTISKVLEKLIHKCVYTFLDTRRHIYQTQYGFLTKHSCEHAVQELLGEILKGMENKQYTVAIFLDFSKAFDSLEHHVLLEKLDKYRIRGTANKWFKSYLNDRRMRVRCHTTICAETIVSDYYSVNYRVPQGGCLGPLLFLIFCNDLPSTLILCTAILFADDTTIYKSQNNLRYLEWCTVEELKTPNGLVL